MKRTAKPLVRTDYMLRQYRTRDLYLCLDGTWSSFQSGDTFKTRDAAWACAKRYGISLGTIVPVRCRPLSTRTKAARKRTR